MKGTGTLHPGPAAWNLLCKRNFCTGRFVSSDEVLEFDATYQGQDIQTIKLKSIKKNQPTTIEVTKSDLTTGVELNGASLSVLDEDGNVIDSWTSVKDEPHVIKYLTVGKPISSVNPLHRLVI